MPSSAAPRSGWSAPRRTLAPARFRARSAPSRIVDPRVEAVRRRQSSGSRRRAGVHAGHSARPARHVLRHAGRDRLSVEQLAGRIRTCSAREVGEAEELLPRRAQGLVPWRIAPSCKGNEHKRGASCCWIVTAPMATRKKACTRPPHSVSLPKGREDARTSAADNSSVPSPLAAGAELERQARPSREKDRMRGDLSGSNFIHEGAAARRPVWNSR